MVRRCHQTDEDLPWGGNGYIMIVIATTSLAREALSEILYASRGYHELIEATLSTHCAEET